MSVGFSNPGYERRELVRKEIRQFLCELTGVAAIDLPAEAEAKLIDTLRGIVSTDLGVMDPEAFYPSRKFSLCWLREHLENSGICDRLCGGKITTKTRSESSHTHDTCVVTLQQLVIYDVNGPRFSLTLGNDDVEIYDDVVEIYDVLTGIQFTVDTVSALDNVLDDLVSLNRYTKEELPRLGLRVVPMFLAAYSLLCRSRGWPSVHYEDMRVQLEKLPMQFRLYLLESVLRDAGLLVESVPAVDSRLD